ncbi:MAG TPA: hypothetical protein VLW50_21865, partial [Streptosporangiaceae bacterium]|nr:hypothetical protein [Streptosporangiaceae bacterium]
MELPEPALAMLNERTEGWVAGLRLAALSLAGHPDPEQFAAEFSGVERTVAEYLLAEVLVRQPESVRRLLLRTSILERVNGELADLLTGDEGGEGTLQDLEQAGAFVASLGLDRSWFRYPQMFASLLRLQLRRAAPGEAAGLHGAASGWFAAHGHPVEAIRHAQAAGDWELAARLLADHWPGLHLDGQGIAIRCPVTLPAPRLEPIGSPQSEITGDSATMTTTASAIRWAPATATYGLELPGVGRVDVTVGDRDRVQPFLLLHGGAGPASVAGFGDLLAARKHARVIMPNHPGFDGAPRPAAL